MESGENPKREEIEEENCEIEEIQYFEGGFKWEIDEKNRVKPNPRNGEDRNSEKADVIASILLTELSSRI